MSRFKGYLTKVDVAIGLVLTDGNKMLIVHSTDYDYGDKYWSFPRGTKNKGEDDWTTLVRETKEETNITLTEEDKKNSISLPLLEYKTGKNIRLFVVYREKLPDINSLKCNEYIERNGKKLIEIDGFKYVKLKDVASNFNGRKRVLDYWNKIKAKVKDAIGKLK